MYLKKVIKKHLRFWNYFVLNTESKIWSLLTSVFSQNHISVTFTEIISPMTNIFMKRRKLTDLINWISIPIMCVIKIWSRWKFFVHWALTVIGFFNFISGCQPRTEISMNTANCLPQMIYHLFQKSLQC